MTKSPEDINLLDQGSLRITCEDINGNHGAFKVIWDSLTFGFKALNGKHRIVLSQFSGSVESGELVAILGPSGVGKSTFLNSLAGQVKPLGGTINFYGKEKKASLAYVPQQDDLCPFLTVRESLILSSKLKNSQLRKHEAHLALVNELIRKFLLKKCENTYASRCSGGESKRLSMALELISNPHFLLLDEPTSGLDSSTAFKCITTLRKWVCGDLKTKRAAVILTIHQPSSKLLQIFDKIYLLGAGSCIYEGPPMNMVSYFSNFGIECPTYYNPADFALELVSDASDSPVMEVLKTAYLEKRKHPSSKSKELDSLRKITSLSGPKSFVTTYFLLTAKLAKCFLRDPYQLFSRLLQYTLFPLVLFSFINLTPYKQSSCTFLAGNDTHVLQETILQHVERRKFVAQKLLLLFLNAFFVFLSANFPAILTVGSHLRVLFKEHKNNWYSLASFASAFITVSCTLTGGLVILNALFTYVIFTDHIYWDQFTLYSLVLLLSSFIGDAFATLIAVLLLRDTLTNIIIAGTIICVLLTASGFVIRYSLMQSVAVILSMSSWFRYIFILLAKTLFSYENCVIGPSKLFSFNQAMLMLQYNDYKQGLHRDITDRMPCSVLSSLKEDEVWNKTTIFGFARVLYDLGQDDAEFEQNWSKDSNFIMSEFNITDCSIWIDFGVLAGIVTLMHVISYAILVYRTRRKW